MLKSTVKTQLCERWWVDQLASAASCPEGYSIVMEGVRKHSRNGFWLDMGLIFQANSFSREKAPWQFGSDILPA